MEVGLFIQTQLLHVTFILLSILNDLLLNHFDLKLKKQQLECLHVCSIRTIKAEGFQFETQHK